MNLFLDKCSMPEAISRANLTKSLCKGSCSRGSGLRNKNIFCHAFPSMEVVFHIMDHRTLYWPVEAIKHTNAIKLSE